MLVQGAEAAQGLRILQEETEQGVCFFSVEKTENRSKFRPNLKPAG